ncbi:O-antigen ligase family protein [Enterococcus avium]|uniref:O-antigen ligase family protein n=1 Tax=Enterococcus avium TaxID=33945 RepID=UPI0028912506|nr:O-antigen ligase family protein [Enterococcus avium]MDT2459463.1 O-antigen ligase family protein [Enterococcus avium]
MNIKKSTLVKIMMGYCISYTMMRSLLRVYLGDFGNMIFISCVIFLVSAYFFNYRRMNVKIKSDLFYYGYFCFFAFFIINYLVSPRASKYGFFEYLFYLLIFFSILYILQYVEFNWILRFYIFISLIVSLQAIWEFFTGNILYRFSYSGDQIIRRSFGLVGSPLTLGMILACTSLISIFLFFHSSRFYIVPSITNIFGLMCTQSRGPILSFMVGIFAMYFFWEVVYSKKKLTTIIYRIILVPVLLILIFVLSNLLIDHNAFFQNIFDRMKTVSDWGANNANNYERSIRWENAIEIFKNNFLIGYGASSTGSNAYTGIVTESGILKVLAEMGLLGFVIYYSFLLYGIISRAKGALKKKSEYAPLAIGIIVAILFENIILQILESVTIFFMFMLMVCYLFYYSGQEQ